MRVRYVGITPLCNGCNKIMHIDPLEHSAARVAASCETKGCKEVGKWYWIDLPMLNIEPVIGQDLADLILNK